MRLATFHTIVAFANFTVNLSFRLYFLSVKEMVTYVARVVFVPVCFHKLLDLDLTNILELVLRDDGFDVVHVDRGLTFLSWA